VSERRENADEKENEKEEVGNSQRRVQRKERGNNNFGPNFRINSFVYYKME